VNKVIDRLGVCPAPSEPAGKVTIAHGGGGRRMHQLIQDVIWPAFDNPLLAAQHDGAVFEAGGARLAMTTDGYVVRPLFFPGGDIGHLAVCGTINDLAMCAAKPLHIAAGLIIEEGFPIDDLARVTASMRATADAMNVTIVTGDTKVVEAGAGDGVYITTTGIGLVETDLDVRPDKIEDGDVVILSGDLGRHGIAVMAAREGLDFETPIESDAAPLWPAVRALLDAEIDVHCLRDLTRGGLATSLIEIADTAGKRIRIDEAAIPVSGPVRGACEILGLDPLYVANEGRFIAIVPEREARRTVDTLKNLSTSDRVVAIGRVSEANPGGVVAQTVIGGERAIDMLSGEQLPRIC
jgi:hydrogenase expression/formation protein HypE